MLRNYLLIAWRNIRKSKVFSLIKRREDMSLDEFRTWILEEHAPKGRTLPGLREYHVSVIEADDPALPYHAVTELYFDDEEAANAEDPVLQALEPEERATLVARDEEGGLRFDIVLQGAGETTFFAV